MVTGELDYQDVFGLSYSVADSNVVTFEESIPEHTANFIWVIFLISVPIILTNMLVSSYCFQPLYIYLLLHVFDVE